MSKSLTAERSQAVALSKHISESCRLRFWVLFDEGLPVRRFEVREVRARKLANFF